MTMIPPANRPRCIDCSLFFNELDLLRVRLEELSAVVDTFVILESNTTFSGRSKPLYFKEYAKEFDDFRERIEYYVVDDMPSVIDGDRWPLERHHRNKIKDVLRKMEIGSSDIVLLSDIDEIPRAENVEQARTLLETEKFVVFVQQYYREYLNNCSIDALNGGFWCGSIATLGRTILEHDPETIRRTFGKCGEVLSQRQPNCSYIENGGWHFSSLGGPDAQFYKLQSFSHSEYDSSAQNGIVNITHCVGRGNLHNNIRFMKSLKTRIFRKVGWINFPAVAQISIEDNQLSDELPQSITSNVQRYRHFFLYGTAFDTTNPVALLPSVFSIAGWRYFKALFILVRRRLHRYFHTDA